jgi:hypothetical protein
MLGGQQQQRQHSWQGHGHGKQREGRLSTLFEAMETKKNALESIAPSEPVSAGSPDTTPISQGRARGTSDAVSVLHAHHVSSMEYSISQPTLEQVFMHFAKEQRDTQRR